jgi:hypothetical protein
MSDRPPTVRVEYEGEIRAGRVVDLRGTGLESGRVRRAIREGEGESGRVRVDCPEPGAVHDHVGVVSPDVSVAVRPALAAAARSRGLAAPQDDEADAVRERLADLTVPAGGPDPAEARRRLAGTETAVERRRERVATLRGRLQAAREAGRDPDDLEADLAEATAALSEAETERAAAREALDRAERRAREERDARERRRRLQDRAANLERAARAHLVERVREEYAAAVADLCGDCDPFSVPDDVAALAVARVADLRAPVVLACDRRSPAAATTWLDAAVVRVRS